jgi:hypothetical protein
LTEVLKAKEACLKAAMAGNKQVSAPTYRQRYIRLRYEVQPIFNI